MSSKKKAEVAPKRMPDLPAGFGTTEGLNPGSGGGGNYLAFLDAKAEAFAEVSAAGVRPNDPYARIEGVFRSLVGTPMHLLAGYGYWSEADEKGRPIGPRLRDEPKTAGLKPKEFAEVVFLAYLEKLVVIPATLRTGTCQILRQARDAIRATELPGWAGDDPIRKSLAGVAPVLRVVGTLRSEQKDSKTSGFKYRLGFFTATLITPSLAAKLAAFNGSPEHAAAQAASQAILADAAKLQ